jgi:hypothetical protein
MGINFKKPLILFGGIFVVPYFCGAVQESCIDTPAAIIIQIDNQHKI